MFPRLPPTTKVLLIANAAVFLLQLALPESALLPFMLWPLGDLGVGAAELGAGFRPWQLLTHGFMHDPSNFTHLMFNMLALWMFGSQLEDVWGQRRMWIYYLVCVAGAGLCQLVVGSWTLAQGGAPYPAIGASGGVFGVLLAYGMSFPKQRVMLLFPPIPMQARTLVIVYGVVELLLGFTGLQPDVAHFAHLGGMLFGWLLIRHWRGQPPFGGGPRRPRVVR